VTGGDPGMVLVRPAASVIAVAGADFGPTTGLAFAAWDRATTELVSVIALECTDGQAPGLLGLLLGAWPYGPAVRVAGMERFVPRAKSQSLRGVSVARMQGSILALSQVFTAHRIAVRLRPAADVKPWATDRRLAAAGLLAATEKFTDARDAGRHMLFTAVQDAGLPDPLSAVTRAARAEGVS